MDFVKNFSNRVKVNIFAVVFMSVTYLCSLAFGVQID